MFEEDVDMELENERRLSSTIASVETPPALPTSITDVTSPTTENEPKATNNEVSSLETEKENRPTTSSKALPESDKSVTEDGPSIKDDPTNDPSEIKSSTSEAPAVESFAAAMSTDVGSRFYIKRRIIVGNVSKYIPLGKFSKYSVPFSDKIIDSSDRTT